MANNIHVTDEGWSFDPINAIGINNHNETKSSTSPDEIESDMDGSAYFSASESSSNYTTPSTTPTAVQTADTENQQQPEGTDYQENTERTGTDHIDDDVIMTDADTDEDVNVQEHGPVGDEWNPTPEELYAIAFAEDEDTEPGTAREHRNQDNQNATVDDNETGTQEQVEDTREEIRDANDAGNPEVEHGTQMDEDETETLEENAQRARDDPANIEADTNPQPQNPWGMSDAQLEQLIVDQDRVFGYIRDRDSAPKPFSCVCGEASMDPSGFVNLTCPDNCVRCVDCLNANVRVGLESKKNYPPRCCVPIDFENVFYHLEPVLIDRWLDVRPEFEDVAPVYCSVKECSLYLPRELFIDNGKWALCNKCEISTCTVCLCPESQHDNSDACPERLDKMDKDLIKDQGWKACPQCREMIERTEGCDHMICECGQEFCYRCGRSYQPPIPCNCHGQNQWAEQLQAEADPLRQQDVFLRITGGDVVVEEDDPDEPDEEADPEFVHETDDPEEEDEEEDSEEEDQPY
ncbi:hypothetical protein ES702_00113 [subsurface metagenome]